MKPWYQSKTIWINVFVAVLAAFEAVTGLLQPIVSANIYAVIAVSLPVINAALRIITTQTLTASSK
jgi:hypothetical protein